MKKSLEVTETYRFVAGEIPLLVSIPHCGLAIPESIAQTMTKSALRRADTDWYLDLLYRFAEELNINVLMPRYSRYVIDLNRPPNNETLYPGADTTELCPTTTFAKEKVYLDDQQPCEEEVRRRVEHYWQPYHQRISALVQSWQDKGLRGIIFEAHSIASQVPRFFTGKLPDFNFGTFDGRSCGVQLQQLVNNFDVGDYSKVVNGRFKGGFITRHYAEPERGIETLQLELSQATYMDEASLAYLPHQAEQVQPILQKLLQALIAQLK